MSRSVSDDNYNLYSAFAEQIERRADQELLTTEDGRKMSCGEVDRLSARMASALTSLGVRPGDRISVQVEKSPESLCLYFACLRAGLVFHPLNMAYKHKELEYLLGNAEPEAVVCDAGNEASLRTISDQVGARHLLTLNADGSGGLAELAADASPEFETVHRSRDDLAALLYSSGTTGVPKGIMLSHWNLLSNTRTLVEAWGFTAGDRLLHALPIFHVHGLFVAIGCAVLSGASMRWLAAFNVDNVIRFLPECTVLMGVPTFYTRLLAKPDFDKEVTRGIRLFVSGSAPLLEETFTAFEQRTGHRILERYGMTETNMNTSNPLDGVRKPGTVGPPLAGVDVRIIGDNGAVLGVDEIGDLLVRGPNVFTGYWKMPEKTAEDFTADGFFRTGDKAKLDSDGYVSIVGRSRDMIISGGLNVYPKEVETVIDDLQGVAESAVIGVPHPDLGEGVVAVVVAAEPSAKAELDVIGECKTQLAGFKVPKRVIFVDQLPRNTMAKVQKNRLREEYASLFDDTA